MSNFAEIICLKCWNFFNYKWREKFKSWCKYMSFLVEASPPLQSRYPIINKKCCQRFRVQRTWCLYILLKFHKLLFFTTEMNFEKSNNYSAADCWTWKGCFIFSSKYDRMLSSKMVYLSHFCHWAYICHPRHLNVISPSPVHWSFQEEECVWCHFLTTMETPPLLHFYIG